MVKASDYELPHWCKIVIEGRTNGREPWGLRNALRDENAAVLDPKSGMTEKKLLEKAATIAEDWRRNYGVGSGQQLRVTVLE